MWSETVIECHYKDGSRKFMFLSKYMLQREVGRPVKVAVTGPVTAADRNGIKNSAAMGATIVYHD